MVFCRGAWSMSREGLISGAKKARHPYHQPTAPESRRKISFTRLKNLAGKLYRRQLPSVASSNYQIPKTLPRLGIHLHALSFGRKVRSMSKRKRGHSQDGKQQKGRKPQLSKTLLTQLGEAQTVSDEPGLPPAKLAKRQGKGQTGAISEREKLGLENVVNGRVDEHRIGESQDGLSRQAISAATLPGTGFAAGEFSNKERVLLLSSRGITYRYRHLLSDLGQLLPHCKKDPKLDTKSDRKLINEIADLKNCTSSIFFECRKKKDLYVWLAKHPVGPTLKFYVTNVHTMAELRLSGNHLKGSRHVLSFSKEFDMQPHWQVAREVLQQVFTVPRKQQKAKPFFDHVISFSIADERIWVRNYQIVSTERKGEDPTLIEVGPRCCMQPIRVFQGSYSGAVLYENPQYVSPNEIRREERKQAAGRYQSRVVQKKRRKEHTAAHPVPKSQFANLFK